MLDVGAGDGLIGLAALTATRNLRHGDLLRYLWDAARAVPAGDQRVWRTGSRSLHPDQGRGLAEIADSSVDVLATRSVLIYVTEKAKAFAAFARVLGSMESSCGNPV